MDLGNPASLRILAKGNRIDLIKFDTQAQLYFKLLNLIFYDWLVR